MKKIVGLLSVNFNKFLDNVKRDYCSAFWRKKIHRRDGMVAASDNFDALVATIFAGTLAIYSRGILIRRCFTLPAEPAKLDFYVILQ